MVRLLLAKGADVDEIDKEGQTALILAASEGHREVVRLLLEKNPNLRTRDKNGWTAAMWAQSIRNKDIIELMEKHALR